MARTTKSWVGKTDDAKAPPRVRQRIFDAHGGICHICILPIKVGETWEADHIRAIINGGANAEENLAPAHSHCHVGKSALDLKEKAKVAAVRQKHIGVKRKTRPIPSKPFAPSDRTRAEKPRLEPKRLFVEKTVEQ